MLNLTNLVDTATWESCRSHHPFKLENTHHLKKINGLVKDLSSKYEGSVAYFENTKTLTGRFMSYAEGTPIFPLFKFVPQKYFIETYEPTHYWKKSPIDEIVADRLLSYRLFKYDLPYQDFNYEPNYRLYVCHSIFDLDKSAIVKSAVWAHTHKQRVVIRLGTIRDVADTENKYERLIEQIYKSGVSKDLFIVDLYSHIDDLVNNCKMMWSANSGVGFAALLKGKPVSHFYKDIDYSYGPVARFTHSADEAFDEDFQINYDDVRRYFTWYYKKLCVDLNRDDAIDMIDEKLFRYFKQKQPISEMLT